MMPGVSHSSAVPYRVELTGAAWRQVGMLSREEFDRLDALLATVAAQVAWGGRDGHRGFLEVPLGPRVVTCELLHAERTVRVLHLSQPGEAQATHC